MDASVPPLAVSPLHGPHRSRDTLAEVDPDVAENAADQQPLVGGKVVDGETALTFRRRRSAWPRLRRRAEAVEITIRG